MSPPPAPVGVVGAGMIGRAWALVFARAGHPVTLWDAHPQAVERALAVIREQLEGLQAAGLVDNAAAALARVCPAATLAAAVSRVAYVQENLPEEVETKRGVFTELDSLAPAEAVLASSTSAIPASSFTRGLAGRHRCLVAHPANPPYLLPVVELCPAPWTASTVVTAARDLLAGAGMAPVHLRRELPGFILNRLQGALLNEAFRLVQEGYVTPEDLDVTVREGLGLRWAFMGPFETIDLNAPGGLSDYCRRYGRFYQTLRRDAPAPEPWPAALIEELDAGRRAAVPMECHAQRQAWRDRCLVALAALKNELDRTPCPE